MPISAQDATIVWKKDPNDSGVVMEEVLQYSLSINPSNGYEWFNYIIALDWTKPLGTLKIIAFKNTVVVPSEMRGYWGRARYIEITHGLTKVLQAWVSAADEVKVDAVRGDVLRYSFSFTIWKIVIPPTPDGLPGQG